MIITRAPFRVSFCGGGSDLPSFYEKYGGCVISTTIRKYVYLCLQPAFNKNSITLKYSKTESVEDVKLIEHKIFRQVLQDFNIKGVEISSMADIPAGTGLGSSSSFTCALLKLLYTYNHQPASAYKIAKEACDIEITKLGSPIGKQDQYASSFGGLKFYEFYHDGFVKVEPIVIKPELSNELQNNLLMFYTGDVRDANNILKEQSKSMITNQEKIEGTKKLCELTRFLKAELEAGNIDSLGSILHKSWLIKKTLANGISNPLIDEYYEKAINAGALGGKLLGAGGGGFLLFYSNTIEKRNNIRKALSNLKELVIEFDQSGCSVVFTD